MIAELGTEPAHILDDRFDVLHVFRFGIRVIEPEMTAGVRELACDAEVQHDRLCMTDVQESVRLGWKARDDGIMTAAGDVVGDDGAYEIAAGHRAFVVDSAAHGSVWLVHVETAGKLASGRAAGEARQPAGELLARLDAHVHNGELDIVVHVATQLEVALVAG